MCERIFYCVGASFCFWFALMYLTSDAVPGGRAQTTFNFYLDIFVSAVVFLVLFTVFLLPLLYLRYLEFASAKKSVALVTMNDTEMYRPTTVSHLENLKSQFQAINKRLNRLRACELKVHERATCAGAFERWLGRRGLAVLRHQRRSDAGRAGQLHYDIERVSAGDVDKEIADYREEIAELRDARPHGGDPDSLRQANREIDKDIRRCERNIAELEQWRKKVTGALGLAPVAESPNEIAWRNFVDTAKRTASVPIIQASSRIEAAMAGLEARRYYDKIVAEQLVRGTITNEEAAFIRRRIQEEFLGGASSVYT